MGLRNTPAIATTKNMILIDSVNHTIVDLVVLHCLLAAEQLLPDRLSSSSGT
jgi:hypothetical protein